MCVRVCDAVSSLTRAEAYIPGKHPCRYPVRVWYDDDTKQLRTDMYGGLDKTIATKVSRILQHQPLLMPGTSTMQVQELDLQISILRTSHMRTYRAPSLACAHACPHLTPAGHAVQRVPQDQQGGL
jgi:hypothetical protein